MHASYLQVVLFNALKEVAEVRRDELCEPGAWRVHGSSAWLYAVGLWNDRVVFVGCVLG